MVDDNHEGLFPGFPQEPVTNYWPYPKALNGWWHVLNGSEQKCLDYILRHTWGYKKVADAIAISQFIHGIKKYDGTVIDRGTGIKNEKTVRKALQGLVKKGFIERIDRSHKGKEPIYKLKFASQEIDPLPNFGIPPVPDNGSPSYQKVVPTIKEILIKNNNTTASKDKKISYKEEIAKIVSNLSTKLGGVSFEASYGKQAKYAKLLLSTGFSLQDILWGIDQMSKDSWWSENGFDIKNVADNLPKLLIKNKKTPKELSKPVFMPCNQEACEGGYVTLPNGVMGLHKCRQEYEEELKDWKEKYQE